MADYKEPVLTYDKSSDGKTGISRPIPAPDFLNSKTYTDLPKPQKEAVRLLVADALPDAGAVSKMKVFTEASVDSKGAMAPTKVHVGTVGADAFDDEKTIHPYVSVSRSVDLSSGVITKESVRKFRLPDKAQGADIGNTNVLLPTEAIDKFLKRDNNLLTPQPASKDPKDLRAALEKRSNAAERPATQEIGQIAPKIVGMDLRNGGSKSV